MDPKTIQNRISEICEKLESIARAYGSNFTVPLAKKQEYAQRVITIPIVGKERYGLEEEQTTAIIGITEEIINNLQEQFDSDFNQKNTSLQEIVTQVQQKINTLTQGARELIKEKNFLIQKYKVVLKSKGPTADFPARIKQVEEVIDQYNKNLEQLQKDQEVIMRQMEEKKTEIQREEEANKIIELQNESLAKQLVSLKQDQEEKARNVLGISKQLEEQKGQFDSLISTLKQQLADNAQLELVGKDVMTAISTLKDQIIEREAELNQGQARLVELGREIVDTAERIQANERFIQVLQEQSQQTALFDKYQADLASKQQELQQLQFQLQQQETDKESAQTGAKQLNDQLARLAKQSDTLQAEIDALNNKLNSITAGLNDLQAETQKLNEQIAQKEGQNQQKSGDLQDLKESALRGESQLQQLVDQNKQLQEQLGTMQGDYAAQSQEVKRQLEKVKKEIEREENKNKELLSQQDEISAKMKELGSNPNQLSELKKRLEDTLKRNKEVREYIDTISELITDIQAEQTILERVVSDFKAKCQELLNVMLVFVNAPSKVPIPSSLKPELEELKTKLASTEAVDDLIKVHDELARKADNLVKLSKLKRLSLSRLMSEMVERQGVLQEFKEANIEENVLKNFSMFDVLMKAYRSGNPNKYFQSDKLPLSRKQEIIQQVIEHHNDQHTDRMKLMTSLQKTIPKLQYYSELLALEMQLKQSGTSRLNGDQIRALEQEKKTIRELQSQLDSMINIVQFYLYSQLLQFYNYVSVFLVPLTVFKSRSEEIKNMAVNFFRAKIGKMQEHAKELANMGVSTTNIGEYIKTLQTFIVVIQRKTSQIQAQNRDKEPGQRVIERTAAYDQVLDEKQIQDKLIKETQRWYGITGSNLNEAEMRKALNQMIPSIKTCTEQLKSLPVIEDLSRNGVNICKYQREESLKGIENLIAGKKSNEWIGIPGYLLSATPYTYELSQFVFNFVIEALVNGEPLEELFTSEYVEILNEYLVSNTTSSELTKGKSVTEEFYKSYGAFLISLKSYYKATISQVPIDKIDTVLAEVLNEAGKSQAVSVARNINKLQNFKDVLVKLKSQNFNERVAELAQQIKEGHFEQEAMQQMSQFSKLAAGLDEQLTQEFKRDPQPPRAPKTQPTIRKEWTINPVTPSLISQKQVRKQWNKEPAQAPGPTQTRQEIPAWALSSISSQEAPEATELPDWTLSSVSSDKAPSQAGIGIKPRKPRIAQLLQTLNYTNYFA